MRPARTEIGPDKHSAAPPATLRDAHRARILGPVPRAQALYGRALRQSLLVVVAGLALGVGCGSTQSRDGRVEPIVAPTSSPEEAVLQAPVPDGPARGRERFLPQQLLFTTTEVWAWDRTRLELLSPCTPDATLVRVSAVAQLADSFVVAQEAGDDGKVDVRRVFSQRVDTIASNQRPPGGAVAAVSAAGVVWAVGGRARFPDGSEREGTVRDATTLFDQQGILRLDSHPPKRVPGGNLVSCGSRAYAKSDYLKLIPREGCLAAVRACNDGSFRFSRGCLDSEKVGEVLLPGKTEDTWGAVRPFTVATSAAVDGDVFVYWDEGSASFFVYDAASRTRSSFLPEWSDCGGVWLATRGRYFAVSFPGVAAIAPRDYRSRGELRGPKAKADR